MTWKSWKTLLQIFNDIKEVVIERIKIKNNATCKQGQSGHRRRSAWGIFFLGGSASAGGSPHAQRTRRARAASATSTPRDHDGRPWITKKKKQFNYSLQFQSNIYFFFSAHKVQWTTQSSLFNFFYHHFTYKHLWTVPGNELEES